MKRPGEGALLAIAQGFDGVLEAPYQIGTGEMSLAPLGGSAIIQKTLILRNVKLFCDRCGSREAFAPIWHQQAPGHQRASGGAQLFAAAYKCQRCLAFSVGFL